MQNKEKPTDEEFLKCLYHNSKCATQMVEFVLPKILDPKIKAELKEMLSAHGRLNLAIEDLSRVYNIDIADNNLFQKMKMWWNVNMNTFFNKGNKKIAGILIMTNTMGVIDLIEKTSLHDDTRKPFLEIARELLELERASIKKLEYYLLTEQNQTDKQKGIEKEDDKKENDDVSPQPAVAKNIPSPDEVKPQNKILQTNINKALKTRENMKPLSEADKQKAKNTTKNKELKNDL